MHLTRDDHWSSAGAWGTESWRRSPDVEDRRVYGHPDVRVIYIQVMKEYFLPDCSHSSGSADVEHDQTAASSRLTYQIGYWVLELTWTLPTFCEPLSQEQKYQ